MSQSLFVNEKEYLPSTVLSKQFGYTSDYISKLAREEKILATRIGRQWFAEPESLRSFSQQADIEKRIRKETLSKERKVERNQKNEEVSPASQIATDLGFDFSALLQSAVVIACGFFVGGLSWLFVASDLQTSDLARGSHAVATIFAEAVTPDFSMFKDDSSSGRVSTALLFDTRTELTEEAQEVKTDSQQVLSGTFTVLPLFPERSQMNSVVSEKLISFEDPQRYFSDEVSVSENDASYVVQPVFKDSEGNRYEFSLVPVTDMSDFE